MPLAEADLMTKVFAMVSLSLGRRSSCSVFVCVHGVHMSRVVISISANQFIVAAARIFGTDDGARDGVGDSTDAATATKREPE